MAKKPNGNGTRVLSEAEDAKFQELLDKEAAEQKVAAEEAERQRKRESFKSLVPERTAEQLAKLVASIKPLLSVRAAHPDHGEIVGVVIEVETLYNRKKENKGKPKGVVVPIVCTQAYQGEVARDINDKPIMDDFHVYQVQPEWIIELGREVEIKFNGAKKANGKNKAA